MPSVASLAPSARSWISRWGPILPLLVAEATIWLGFGALLPILPIYFTQHGTDLPTLGIVIAAWPAARLIAEPLFGWAADRTARKPLMIGGLLVAAIATVLPLAIVGPAAFIVLRAVTGLGAAAYDPAARGYLVDTMPRERHGEMFGLYGSAQFGGFVIGPAVGGIAAALTGEPTIVFWVAGLAIALAALLVAWRVPERPRERMKAADERGDDASAVEPEDVDADRPKRLLNPLLVAAMLLNAGGFFAAGAYEVVWSLYLTSLGAGLGAIGITFAAFGLPVLVVSPLAGRFVDRRGGYAILVIGSLGVAIAGPLYPVIPEVWWVVVLSLVEGTAFAMVSPTLFALVARATPAGRSSTAQGIFGAAGTLGTIIASIAAGAMADVDLRIPFIATGVVAGGGLVAGLLIGGRPLQRVMQPRRPVAGDAEVRVEPDLAAPLSSDAAVDR